MARASSAGRVVAERAVSISEPIRVGELELGVGRLGEDGAGAEDGLGARKIVLVGEVFDREGDVPGGATVIDGGVDDDGGGQAEGVVEIVPIGVAPDRAAGETEAVVEGVGGEEFYLRLGGAG